MNLYPFEIGTKLYCMYFKRKRLDFSTMSSPERDVSVMYCCTKQTHQVVENEKFI